jgi:hypothetical protein
VLSSNFIIDQGYRESILFYDGFGGGSSPISEIAGMTMSFIPRIAFQ